MKKLQPEDWKEPLIILVILAHPDDPEFFCGGSIARWVDAGHEVIYSLLTKGDKGLNGWVSVEPKELTRIREKEQRNAAKTLGVKKVNFLSYKDGYLVADLDLRKAIVAEIRREKPDILVSCDPHGLYFRDNALNHPDHIAAGKAAVEAVYPAAGNPLFFPELLDKNLQPHSVKEVWLSLPEYANTILDVTANWEKKIDALTCHQSQVGDIAKFKVRMKSRRTPESSEEEPQYLERFRRICFR
jgi:LmbE family N-acetylglucosaminyl deacetylase